MEEWEWPLNIRNIRTGSTSKSFNINRTGYRKILRKSENA